jgi:hypothetical protein
MRVLVKETMDGHVHTGIRETQARTGTALIQRCADRHTETDAGVVKSDGRIGVVRREMVL